MQPKNAFVQYVHDAAASPTVAKAAAAATTATGFSTYYGLFERGVGLAVSLLGAAVTYSIWQNNQLNKEMRRLEIQEAKLRIRELERRLQEGGE